MPGIDYRQAREQLRLGAVLELLGFVPRSTRGACVRGPCPVHRSRHATSRSFAAHLGKGVWHCFGCGAGGNVLDLWVAVTGQGLHTAVIDLCRRLGRDVPWLPANPKATRSAPAKETDIMPDS
jgi:DNA primase